MTKFDYLFERVRLGIDVHPSEIEMEELVSIAQKISPNEISPGKDASRA